MNKEKYMALIIAINIKYVARTSANCVTEFVSQEELHNFVHWLPRITNPKKFLIEMVLPLCFYACQLG